MADLYELRSRAQALLQCVPDRSPPDNRAEIVELSREQHLQEVEIELQFEEYERVRRELIQSRDEFRLLFELAPVGYLQLDQRGTVLQANRAAHACLRARQLVGRPLMAFLTEAAADALTHLLRRPGDGATWQSIEIQLRGNAGGDDRQQLVCVPRPGAPGRHLVVLWSPTALPAALPAVRSTDAPPPPAPVPSVTPLPVQTPPKRPELKPAPRLTSPGPDERRPGGHEPKQTVLLVQPDPKQGALIQGQLEQAGFEVRLAEDARQAGRMLQREKVHLVVSALDMPGYSGLDLAHFLRARRPDVAVALISMRSAEDLTDLGTLPRNTLLLKPTADDDRMVPALQELLAAAR